MPENTSSPSQKGRIFISYRRIDSAGYAGRIYDRLVAYFGEDAIFMDVDTIEGGTDFIKVLEDAVQSCDVLIALIGKQWLTIKDKGGKPRLDNPEDFVRIEIATALKRNIRVIPVLVDGVDMPQPTELPENLKALARRNALQVNHHSFNPDVYRLIEHSESALNEAEESRVMKAQALQVAREKAGGEKANRELADKIARDKAAKDAIEKAQLEAEELARQKAIKEKAVHEAAEKAKREKAERQAARWNAIKNLLPKLVPFLRIIGIVGIIIVLVWAGSWAVPKFIALVPTSHATATVTQRSVVKETSTNSPVSPTKTLKPNATSTKARTAVPTSLPTEITDAKGVSMVLVPAGNFIFGDISSGSSNNVYLDSFYIDKYEVTNGQYSKCVSVGACRKPLYDNSNHRSHYYSDPRYADYPVIYAYIHHALAYCQWRTARLPTASEWEKASRGTDGRIYPWGDQSPSCDLLNFSDCIRDTAKVGSYTNGKSPYGAYDMAGNVFEWVYKIYDSTLPPEDPYGYFEFELRGGAWDSDDKEARLYFPTIRMPNWGSYYIYYNSSFRCARSAP